MNYREINKAIISKTEVPEGVEKNDFFYNYLLKNNVAHYYAKHISEENNDRENEIIEKGDKLNQRFIETLKIVLKICNENDIDFALHKTYKHIEEAVDGDIDCIVREKDFHKFLDLMRSEGFSCKEEGVLKGCCEKEGFLKIEPRCLVSFHNFVVIGEEEIWNNVVDVNFLELNVKSTSKKFDTLCLLLNCLYGPKYMRLYLRLLARDFKVEEYEKILKDKNIIKDIEFLTKDLITSSVEDKHPVFFSNVAFFLWWLRRILFKKTFSLKDKFRHIVFFYYSKCKARLFNKLHFEHKW